MKLDFSDNLRPERVLYEFDQPLIFTSRDSENDMVFVYQCGEEEDESANHYLIVPFDDERLADLTEGRMPVLEALSQPWIWFAKGRIGSIEHIERCSLNALPAEATLPDHSVMLWPSLEPLLSFRIIGEHIKKGEIPGSVVKQGIDAPSNAIKGIADYLTEKLPPEAEEALSRMRSVKVQRITYASFDVGLRVEMPEAISPNVDPAREMRRLLTAALDAAGQADFSKPLGHYFQSAEEGKVVLDAVRELTPPTYGAVTATQVGGRLVNGGRIRELSRESRRYVLERAAKPKDLPDVIQTFVGFIREMDLDKWSFILRDIQGENGERKCRFSEEHEEEVNRLWNQRGRVQVTARIRKNRAMELISICENS